RDRRVPRRLRGPALRARPPARRPAVHPPAPTPERRVAALLVLHDLGPEDHTRLAHGADAGRGPRPSRRVVRAVPPVPPPRHPVVARGWPGGGSPPLPPFPGPQIRVGPASVRPSAAGGRSTRWRASGGTERRR